MSLKRFGDLELENCAVHARRERIADIIGTALMFAVVVAAFLGYFGKGPRARRTASAGDDVTVAYDRFPRWQSQTVLEIRSRSQDDDGRTRVFLDDDLIDASDISSVMPTPERIQSAPGGLLFVFEARERGIPLRARFETTPDKPGPRRGQVIVRGHAADIRQFVYP